MFCMNYISISPIGSHMQLWALKINCILEHFPMKSPRSPLRIVNISSTCHWFSELPIIFYNYIIGANIPRIVFVFKVDKGNDDTSVQVKQALEVCIQLSRLHAILRMINIFVFLFIGVHHKVPYSVMLLC